MANRQKLCKRIQILSEPRLAAAAVTYVATLIEINFHKRHGKYSKLLAMSAIEIKSTELTNRVMKPLLYPQRHSTTTVS